MAPIITPSQAGPYLPYTKYMSRLRPLVTTNTAFLVPLAYAAIQHLWWYVCILGLATLLSTIYHLSGEQRLRHADVLLAYALITSNFYLIFTEPTPNAPVTLAALAAAAVAVWFYLNQKRNYTTYHSAYHTLSALVCLLCVYAYTN